MLIGDQKTREIFIRFDTSPNPDKAVKRHQPDIENVRIPLGSHLKVKRLEKRKRKERKIKKRKIQIDSLSMFMKKIKKNIYNCRSGSVVKNKCQNLNVQ